MSFQSRTIEQIYNAIVLEKNSMATLASLQPSIDSYQTLLSDLSTTSKVAEWRLWAFNTSVAIWALEQQINIYRADINSVLNTTFVTTANWYITNAKLWQEGDTIEVDPINFNLYYPIVDTSKYRIGSCAVLEQSGKVILKIRGLSTNILTSDQLIEFSAYINAIKPVGTKVSIWNYEPDTIKLYLTINYNKQYPLLTIQSNVETTINEYLNNIEFNSEFNVNKLIDKLQLVTGVIDPRFDEGYAKAVNASTYTQFTHTYGSLAGYMVIDSGFPLSNTILYI